MTRVRVLAAAADDIERGRFFYDSLAPGVGDVFAISILRELGRLEFLHGVHPLHFGLHRMLVRRFPFAIYYREMEKRTEVLAVLDLRRNPARIRSTLARRKK